VVCVAALVVFGPGLVVLLALGVRQRLVLLGASAPASVGVALLVASGAALTGHRFGPTALLSGTFMLAAVGVALWWLVTRFAGPPGQLGPVHRAVLPELTGYFRLVARLIGLVLVLVGMALTVRMWEAALGGWNTWNQDHDPILHALLTAYIMRTGRGAPWQIMPADVIIQTPTVYYPDGFHLLGAAIADVFGHPMIGMNGAAAMVLGPAWVASAAALAGVAVRWLGWRPIRIAGTTAPPTPGAGTTRAAGAGTTGSASAGTTGSAGAGVTSGGVRAGGAAGGRARLAGLLGGVRRGALSRDGSWSPLGAGIGAVVAAGMYRPGVELARDNGLLPNACALVLVPGVLAALLLVRPKGWTSAVGIGLACAGVVTVHPSAGLSVGMSIAAIWLAMLFTRDGRSALRAQLPVLVTVLGAAGLVGAPVLHGALAVSSRIAAFPPDSTSVPISRTLGNVIPLIYGGMFDHRPIIQVWPTLLLVIGLAGALVLRRALPLVVVWAMWVVVVLLAHRNPRGVTAPILGFFYNSAGRVQAHIPLFVPALGTVGVFTVLGGFMVVLRQLGVGPIADVLAWVRRAFDRLGQKVRLTHGRPLRRRLGQGERAYPVGERLDDRLGERVLCLLGVAMVATFGFSYAGGPTNKYLTNNAQALSQRWRYPQLYRVDQDDIAAADWLRARIKPGERIMNSPNDGSTWLYVQDGLPIVELSTLGVPDFPYTWWLMKNFQNLEFDRYVRAQILRLNIGWVYVDSRAPIIGAWGAPDNWTGGGLMTTVPGLTDLDNVAGLTLVHVVGSIRIYQVDQAAIAAMDTGVGPGGPS
jgi:hypothetical protein